MIAPSCHAAEYARRSLYLIYTSNKFEGSRLTQEETFTILHTFVGKTDEHEIAKVVQAEPPQLEKHRRNDQTHSCLVDGGVPRRRRTRRATWTTCSFGDAQSVLAFNQLVARNKGATEEKVDSCLLAAWLKAEFSLIHPFNDGNGCCSTMPCV
ncbi:hypothetical protein QOT17_005806 [Balamuthia mandrillaris]